MAIDLEILAIFFCHCKCWLWSGSWSLHQPQHFDSVEQISKLVKCMYRTLLKIEIHFVWKDLQPKLNKEKQTEKVHRNDNLIKKFCVFILNKRPQNCTNWIYLLCVNRVAKWLSQIANGYITNDVNANCWCEIKRERKSDLWFSVYETAERMNFGIVFHIMRQH